jgi:hypothetical protein
MDDEKRKQYIRDLENKKWEDLETEFDRRVYKELYPEYKTKKDRFFEWLAVCFILPIIMLPFCFVLLFRPRPKSK